jgi:hypothetical protein
MPRRSLARILFRVNDFAGVVWEVRESRPTPHGFELLIGWPQGEPRGKGGRGVAVILTPQLASYLTGRRLCDADLPIGTTAIKRLRRIVGVALQRETCAPGDG